MFWGRIIGAIIGYTVSANPLGALIGFGLGLYFDRGLSAVFQQNISGMGGNNDALKSLFMQLLFTSLGQIAKADGHVSQSEVDHTEKVIKDFSLDEGNRQQAIAWFQQGAKQDNNYQSLMDEFAKLSAHQPQLKQVLLEIVISLAMADGELHHSEEVILLDIAKRLGVAQAAFQQLLDRLKGQQHFAHAPANDRQQLQNAYQALGTNEAASDSEVKKAYRRLMSEHHPDKLMAQGVPDDAIKLATQKSQTIQAAYDLIKKTRKAND